MTNDVFTLTFQRVPNKIFHFHRVNVILGANGTGKTKILKDIRDNAGRFFVGKSIIYVEGGRTIKLTDTLEVNRTNFQQYNTLEKAESTHKQKRMKTLSDRVVDALMLLDRKGQAIKEKHSDEIDKWIKGGKIGEPPARSAPPLEKLFELFSEIFPAIKLELSAANKRITCSKKGSSPYSPLELSDGEKQVLSILTDVAILAEENSLVLVDEPELNLNPSLASRVWETIETDLSNCTFVYTTHDVGFSMRRNVEKVLVLSNENENITEINNINQIGTNDLRLFLGSIPAILSTSSALITEGRPDSLDPIFYRWIIGQESIEIVPMDSSSDVAAVANRQGVWEAIAPSVKLKGIIDRDFKSEQFIQSIETSKSIVLSLNEAESYLCLPEIIIKTTSALGLRPIPTADEINIVIKQEFDSQLLKIAALRVFEKSTLKLSVSIQKNVLKEIATAQELEDKLIEASREQANLAQTQLSEENVKVLLKTELDNLKNVSDSNAVKEMIQLMPGKTLLAKLFRLTGASNIHDYARACAKHINVEDIEELKNLRTKLLA